MSNFGLLTEVCFPSAYVEFAFVFGVSAVTNYNIYIIEINIYIKLIGIHIITLISLCELSTR